MAIINGAIFFGVAGISRVSAEAIQRAKDELEIYYKSGYPKDSPMRGVKEASDYLRISRSTLYRIRRKDAKLPEEQRLLSFGYRLLRGKKCIYYYQYDLNKFKLANCEYLLNKSNLKKVGNHESNASNTTTHMCLVLPTNT